MAPLTQEQKPVAKVVNDNARKLRKSRIIWISQHSCVSKRLRIDWNLGFEALCAKLARRCIVHFGWIGNLAR